MCLTNEPYDDKLDAATSKATTLLENINEECKNDQSCVDSLLEVKTPLYKSSESLKVVREHVNMPFES